MSGGVTVASDVLAGEGDTKVTVKTRYRRECDNCGEPATKRHTFCYLNGRSNPASSMYGRDDCSWCSDHDAFACDECESEVKRACCPNGMDWGGTYTVNNRFAHMFLEWRERDATTDEAARLLGAQP
jgi:hypothetical protein